MGKAGECTERVEEALEDAGFELLGLDIDYDYDTRGVRVKAELIE